MRVHQFPTKIINAVRPFQKSRSAPENFSFMNVNTNEGIIGMMKNASSEINLRGVRNVAVISYAWPVIPV